MLSAPFLEDHTPYYCKISFSIFAQGKKKLEWVQ